MEQSAHEVSPRRYAIRLERAAREFRTLPIEVQALLRLCDGTRSLHELREASDFSPQLFGRVLARLEAQGLIGAPAVGPVDARAALAWTRDVGRPLLAEPAPSPEPEPALATPIDFSMDEEEFFSQTIDHLLAPEERTSTSTW